MNEVRVDALREAMYASTAFLAYFFLLRFGQLGASNWSETRSARRSTGLKLTNISQTHAPDAVYGALVPHFSENQVVDLTLIVANMNAWNRIAIGYRTQPPKR